MKCSLMVAVALTAATGLATAADFSAQFIGFDGTSDVFVNGVEQGGAGHITMQYDANGAPAQAVGQFSGASFATFCVEIDQGVGGNFHDYDIVSLADAPNPAGGISNPNPGNPYGNAIAGRVHEVVASAIAAGWIQWDLSLGSASDAELAAVQALIWDAIYGPAVVTTTRLDVQNAMDDLVNNWWVDNGRVAGLRAMVSSTGQDMLFVVPLPPAAFAGLATLFGVAGVARLRRR